MGRDLTDKKGPAEPERAVRYLFDPSSIDAQIIVIDDFISDEECDAVQTQATPRLARATHAHEGDLSHVSKARDSQQATVRPEGGRKNEATSDPIARLKSTKRRHGEPPLELFATVGRARRFDGGPVQPRATIHALHGSCDGTPLKRRWPVRDGIDVLRRGERRRHGLSRTPASTSFPKRGQAVYFSFQFGFRRSHGGLAHGAFRLPRKRKGKSGS